MNAPADSDAPLFRPNKKRKLYRHRSPEEDDMTGVNSPPLQSLDELIASASNDAKSDAVSLAEIMRLRKQRKPKAGVEFRPVGSTVGEEEERTAEEKDEKDDSAQRFAPQTGAVGDMDRHMMAYIDSELSKRGTAEATSKSLSISDKFVQSGDNSQGSLVEKAKQREKMTEAQRQPAAIGKLMEIDLGDEARDRNVYLTEKARRKLEGVSMEEEDATNKRAKTRPGLGPDGNKWRYRKKRRDSDDVKRDLLVEDFLRENRVEMYDELPTQPTTSDDQAADDIIAEEFRKEFMDSQKQKKKSIPGLPPNRNPVKRKEEEEMKGPKMGGSRNARAAMKEAMSKQAKK
ncbi:hepatocellular carcinoma-associated antigen 59-domain-containing protein [Calycina marina]|uniref:Hepatocellular carcinoma-associated antigen 59-domain-containing protein n=1 Tax=Calycina marina TaxID=1763456 RepID=A0A9P7YWX4_9HELO|nr:hepatocellular carcinoma-associated antigen 59-domain-containing protein [Calycina marina]